MLPPQGAQRILVIKTMAKEINKQQAKGKNRGCQWSIAKGIRALVSDNLVSYTNSKLSEQVSDLEQINLKDC